MKIGVINTGGTICCVDSPLHPMTADEFFRAYKNILEPSIKNEFEEIDVEFIKNTKLLDSTNLQPTDWCEMARYILNGYQTYDGWVLLHGTDSMAFTGSALSFLLSCFASSGISTAVLSKPVIITGSQVPMFYRPTPESVLKLNFNTDAYQNFCGAIACARRGIPEVCVYFQNDLYRGNRVLKTNASEFNAFSSPNYPALAEYGVELTLYPENILPGPVSNGVSLDNPEIRKKVLDQLDVIQNRINQFTVMQLNAFPAWYNDKENTALISELIDTCVGVGIKGLILESYGEGNFPSGNPDKPSSGAIYKSLMDANRKGVVIVDCTQVISGVVNSSAYASGSWLPDVGALDSADMTPMAAFAKLMILLASAKFNNWTSDDVKKLMQLNLNGEMINVSRLDSRINSELLPGQSISSLDGSATLTNDQVRGPILKDRELKTLWSIWGWSSTKNKPSAEDMPGRLVIQNDGNLVYYSRFNVPLWATNTGINSGASSQLIIGGSYVDKTLSLQVYNYSDNKVSITLYQQSI